MNPVDRLVAVLAKCDIKAYVLPTDTSQWRNMTQEQSDACDAAEVRIYARTNGDLCVFVKDHRGHVFDAERLLAITTKLESSPHGPEMAMRVLRGMA